MIAARLLALSGSAEGWFWILAAVAVFSCLVAGACLGALVNKLLGLKGEVVDQRYLGDQVITKTQWRSEADFHRHQWIMQVAGVLGLVVGIGLAVGIRLVWFTSPYEPGMSLEECRTCVTAWDARVEVHTPEGWRMFERRRENGWEAAPESAATIYTPATDRRSPEESYRMRDPWHDVELYFDSSGELIRID